MTNDCYIAPPTFAFVVPAAPGFFIVKYAKGRALRWPVVAWGYTFDGACIPLTYSNAPPRSIKGKAGAGEYLLAPGGRVHSRTGDSFRNSADWLDSEKTKEVQHV